jgi:hypothetical protein
MNHLIMIAVVVAAVLLYNPIVRLIARWETFTLARTMESLAVAAKACHDMDEGRHRESLLAALKDRLDSLGLNPATDEHPEEGPRGVFLPDGNYEAPGGAVWDFSSSDGDTAAKIENELRPVDREALARDGIVLEDGYRQAGNP